MNKYLKMIGFYLAILLIIIVAVTFLNPTQKEVKTIVYSELLTELESNQVAEIEINNSNVTGVLRNGEAFEAVVPQYVIDQQVTPYILANDVKVTITKQQDSWWISLIPSVIIIVLMVVFFLVFSQQAGGGGGKVMSFGKRRT